MSMEIDCLERCRFLQGFQPKHLEKLAALGLRGAFQKDEIVFRKDDTSSRFYLILSGRVALEANAGTSVVVIETLHSGDVLGWSAVLGRPKQFQARALESVETLAFEAAHVRDACDANPYFARAFLETLLASLAERLQSTRLQLALSSTPAGQRSFAGASELRSA